MASSAWSWHRLVDGTPLPDLIRVLNTRLTELTSALRGVGPSFDTLADGVVTPNVVGAQIWKAANAGAINLTGFVGKAGQTIVLWAVNNHTTLVHSAALSLKGGANVTMAATETRTLATLDGVNWRET